MNLLTDDWLPVRPLYGGSMKWIGLSELLTTANEYEICLPRDDLELAALQLVICITQVLFTPDGLEDLVENLRKPMQKDEYQDGIRQYMDWFSVDHPDYPFMQVRGVKAKETTPMDKLLAGLTGATNSCFVNEAGQADSLCGGCAAISLFNQASNAPSFGGGFKAGLRGGTPITTLVQGHHLRETVWLNILSLDQIDDAIPDYKKYLNQPPTWVLPIEGQSNIQSSTIGFCRGLLWQPCHIELCLPNANGKCSCCGRNQVPVYSGFLKANFNYNVHGLWGHPHSPRLLKFSKENPEEKYASFTTPAPTWTRLASFVVKKEVSQSQKEGHQPAVIVLQACQLFYRWPDRLRLAIGGYRNKQASIIERRHEVFDLNKGWPIQPGLIQEFVDLGLGYKAALRSSLFIFFKGMKDIKGAGVAVQELGETQFYQRTDSLMQKALAEAHFEDPNRLAEDKDNLRSGLKRHTLNIFEEQTRPYLNDPELIRTMAIARRTLYKKLSELEPENKGGEQ